METVIDKLRTLQAAADILGVSVKDLIDTHSRRGGVSVGSGDCDPQPRAVSVQQDAEAGKQSDLVQNTSSAPTTQYPTFSKTTTQNSAPPTACSGSGAQLTNNWFPSSVGSLLGFREASPGINGAKPDLASASLDYLGVGGPISSSPSLQTSQIAQYSGTEQAAADLWLVTSGVSAYDNDFYFRALLDNQDGQLVARDAVGDTLSLGDIGNQLSDQHLIPHEPLLGLSPIPFLDQYTAAQESCTPLQAGAGDLISPMIPSFAVGSCSDLFEDSQNGPVVSTFRGSSPLEKGLEGGAGLLRPLKSHPAPLGTGGLARTPRKRKRRRYDEQERSETHITRTIGGCIACRSRRKRCKRISDDPSVPCEYCLSVPTIPCFRARITDCSLYRKTNNSPFETDHPLTGPDFGNFSRRKIWPTEETRVFECGQGHATTLRLRVRRFLPPKLSSVEQIDNKGLGAKGRHLYAIPWAIADLDEALAEVHRYLDSSVSPYIHKYVGCDGLVSPIFWHAHRLAEGPNPNILVMQTLRFWTAARFIEGGWRCTGEDKLGAETVSPPWRSEDNISLPPYLDYELSSIFMEKILKPLELAVLGGLARMVGRNRPDDWFTVVIVIVILMHSFESILQHETMYTHKRGIREKFDDMKLVQQYLWSVKTLLAHFHGLTRGALPFEPPFDPESTFSKWIPELEGSQLQVVQSIAQQLQWNGTSVSVSSNRGNCDSRFWCIGQVFDTRWKPRKDPEDSPLHSQIS